MQNRNEQTINKGKIRVADTVISILEERIFKGKLKEGTRLPAERELS